MLAAREREGRRAPASRRITFATCVLATFAFPLQLGGPALGVTSGETQIAVLAAPQSSGALLEGQPLTVRVTLSNDGVQASGGLSVELRVDGAQPASAVALASWFADDAQQREPLLDEETVASRASIDGLAPGASAVLDLVVPAGSPLWDGSFGPRLAEVVVEDNGQWIAADRTAVVLVPTGITPPSVATTFVQPLTTPGQSDGLLSAETISAETEDSGSLSRTLSASAGRPVLLAIDPRVIASIRVLGDQAPPSALAFLDRLIAAPNENFLLPWADADPVASINALGTPLPLPEGLGRVAVNSPAAEPPAVGAPTAQPTQGPNEGAEQTVPVNDLLDWAPTIEGLLWLESDGLSATVFDALGEQDVRALLAPSSALDTNAGVQQYNDLIVLRTETALADAAQAATMADSQQRFDRAMARLSSLLAATASTEPGAPAIIPLSRQSLPSSDRLLDTVAQTISLAWSTPALVSAAIGSPAQPASVTSPDRDESRIEAVVAGLNAETADRQFAEIALSPALITDLRRLELLAALSLGWGDRSISALESFVSGSAQLRSSVQVVESSDILLLTDRATLPVTVQNDLDVPVRVFVRVEPDSGQLRVLDPNVETIVEPRSQTRTLVPVESLTNGEVDLTVTVRDAEGRVLSEPTRVALSLQAGWETAGTIIVAAAIALLFVVGIARDLRKRRRHSAPASPPDGPEPVSATQTASRGESIR